MGFQKRTCGILVLCWLFPGFMWAQAHKPGKGKKRAAPVDTVLVKISGGVFRIGDPFGDGFNSEQPVHSIQVSDFYLSKYEVTFQEFDAFCDATGHSRPDDEQRGRGNFPVVNVNWYDAVEYCNWRSTRQGLRPVYTIDKTIADPTHTNPGNTQNWSVTADWAANGYRLPTEAEWEFAARAFRDSAGVARGGGLVRFGDGSNRLDPARINVDASYFTNISMEGKARGHAVPVDSLPANTFGLKNMSGNVWEWCWDWYDRDMYKKLAEGAQDTNGALSGRERVVRGGSWSYYVEDCQTTRRSLDAPSFYSNSRGFRVARRL